MASFKLYVMISLLWMVVQNFQMVETEGWASMILKGLETLQCTISIEPCCGELRMNAFRIEGLEMSLQQKLFGQHFVARTVIPALRMHLSHRGRGKPLVLSFHGWPGSGKTYVSKMIAEQLFHGGMQSKFVSLHFGSADIPHDSKLSAYQENLRATLREKVTMCKYSLFIFDEIDKMPGGVLDALRPFVDNHAYVDGVDYSKAIFIFLSNTGGTAINARALQQWNDGGNREDIELKEMEEIIENTAFNKEGGLWRSSLIHKSLIDVFVPFLPLDKQHVKSCIREDMKTFGLRHNEDFVNRVADEMQFLPPDKPLFSKSGCRGVPQKISYIFELDMYDRINKLKYCHKGNC